MKSLAALLALGLWFTGAVAGWGYRDMSVKPVEVEYVPIPCDFGAGLGGGGGSAPGLPPMTQ